MDQDKTLDQPNGGQATPHNSGTITSDVSMDFAVRDVPSAIKIEDNNEFSKLLASTKLNAGQKEEVIDLLKPQLEMSVSSLKSEMKKESEDTKKDFLTFFGLFASFVTFLSIEIQLFKNSDNVWELVGVSSLSLSFVMFFALMLNDLVKGDCKFNDLVKAKYLINLAFMIVGISCLMYGSFKETDKLIELDNKRRTSGEVIRILNKRLLEADKRIDTLQALLIEGRYKATPRPLSSSTEISKSNGK